MLCLDFRRQLVLPQTLECCLAQVSVAGKTLVSISATSSGWSQ